MNRRGFTLIELLVVIAIIAIMGAALMPTLSVANDRARVAECRAHLAAIGIAMDQFTRDRGARPASLDELYRAGYITDESLLLCSKTGAHYHYTRGAKASAQVMVSCVEEHKKIGTRPHSNRESLLALRAGGAIVELGR